MLKTVRIFTVLLVFAVLASCHPVNYFTRLKKTPREYTFNYCGEEVKSPKSDFDKQIWVVFSDRDNNASYVNPGGKVKFKEFAFMDAFLVLKKKGEFLQLIKYDSQNIHDIYNRKLKDRKKAEYCGWIHESKLLLTRQGITDISSGLKSKHLTIITNSALLADPNEYFAADSILTFKDENLIDSHGKAPFYNIVYVLKRSANNEKSLIAKKPIVSPDSIKSEILGWVPTSLIKNVGERLHIDLETIPDSLVVFKDRERIDTLQISKWDYLADKMIGRKNLAMKYNPVSVYKREDKTEIALRTAITTPVIDNKNNYVFNVNGNKISQDKFKEIERDSRKLNILFVLEGHEGVINAYSEIANVIQNLQPLFEDKKNNDFYSYRFGFIFTTQGYSPESYPRVKSSGLMTDYTQLMDTLISEIDSKEPKAPIPLQYAWSGVKKAVDIFEPYKDETNILVAIGGTGYSEWADSTLVRRIGDVNCRILGFQMQGVKEVPGNNFVLQIENMIEVSAKQISKAKREKLVYTNQIKSRNLFTETSKNVYRLDFPDYSMSQGWILFPEKDGVLPLDILTNSIDSLVTEVKWDNENIISNLYNAFNTVGKQRDQYSEVFAKYDQIKDVRSLNKIFAGKFPSQTPVAYIPSQRVSLPDSINEHAKYHLLLSKEESDNLVLFIERLSAIEVDIKYKGEKKEKSRSYCNCPDDDDFRKDEEIKTTRNDSLRTIEYRNTGKLRKTLEQTYINELTNCKLCKRSKKVIKEYTLGEAQQYILGIPSYTKLLSLYKVGDLRDKKKLSDAELDVLIEYFKKKKEELVKSLSSLEKFESNGETYYWVHQGLLP